MEVKYITAVSLPLHKFPSWECDAPNRVEPRFNVSDQIYRGVFYWHHSYPSNGGG